MNWLQQLLIDLKSRVMALFGRGALRARVEEEMQLHIEMRARRLVEAGVAPVDANRRARREFGNLALLKDSAADMWRYGTVERLRQDVRYGLRALVRTPGFTVIAVAVLALAIGVNTTVFSLVNALFLRPLPVAHPETIVSVYSNRWSNTLLRSFLEYRDRNSTLSGLVGCQIMSFGFRIDGDLEHRFGEIVSGNYFAVLGLSPALGRLLTPADDGPDAPPVVVLSHGFWQRRFGRSPDVAGHTLTLNDRAFTIIGVAPAGFTGVTPPLVGDFWVPLAADAVLRPAIEPAARLDALSLHLLGRLKPGVDRMRAQADLDTIGRQLRAATGQVDRGPAVTVYDSTVLHPEIRTPVAAFTTVLMAIVGLVLMIVCVNVANLVLARTVGRDAELAVRQSLGAGRGRLIRQLLTENLLLSLMGAGAGVAIAYWSTRLLMAVELPTPIPLALDLGIDLRVLLFVALIAVAATVVVGAAPALAASRVDLVRALKGLTADGRRHSRLRAALLVTQVSMSVLLLVIAGLFLRAFRTAQAINPGFNPAQVLTATLDLETRGYPPARGRELVRTLVERLDATPGVISANAVDILPLTFSNNAGYLLRDGDTPPLPNQPPPTPLIYMNGVGPGHFATLQIPIIEGRDFSARDVAEGPRVGIVNETLAHRFWPGQPAIGQHLRPAGAPASETIEIVGVARDSKYVTLGEEARPFLYRPIAQAYTPMVTLLVRTAGQPQAALPLIARAVHELDTGLAVFNVASLEDATAVSLLPVRLAGRLLGALGFLALALAAMGIYGVLSFLVSARAREFAIRVAVGATPSEVVMMVTRHALVWTVTGAAIGLAMAVLLTRLLAGFLYGVSPTDPWTLGAVTLVLLAVACGAALPPALRASRQDPLATLRSL